MLEGWLLGSDDVEGTPDGSEVGDSLGWMLGWMAWKGALVRFHHT